MRRESFTRNPGLDARSTVTGCPLHNVLYSADLRSKRLSRIVPPSSDSNRREGDWLSFKAIPSGVASFTMRTCCTGGTGLFAIHFSSAARAAAAFSGDLFHFLFISPLQDFFYLLSTFPSCDHSFFYRRYMPDVVLLLFHEQGAINFAQAEVFSTA